MISRSSCVIVVCSEAKSNALLSSSSSEMIIYNFLTLLGDFEMGLWFVDQ